MVGTTDSVLIREVALIQSALFREVPLYTIPSGFFLTTSGSGKWLFGIMQYYSLIYNIIVNIVR